jgi:hypothetical protein
MVSRKVKMAEKRMFALYETDREEWQREVDRKNKKQ